VPLYFDILGL